MGDYWEYTSRKTKWMDGWKGFLEIWDVMNSTKNRIELQIKI